jgi:2-polyprenyl-6-methoxyphenol hydroxylase-like FAD-dependent oxidoreductase
MIDTTKPVLIAGAGIVGLTTALFLHRAGIPVQLFESVREIKPLGVGLNLLPHAVARLYKLGLQGALAQTGIKTKALSFYSRRGSLIWSEPRGLEAGYPVPQFSIHRGELQMLLLRAVRDRLGDAAVRTGHALASFEQNADGVTAHFVDRAGNPVGSATGSVLLGADGVMSRVRAHFYPNEGVPDYSGLILWRASVEAEPFLDGRTMVMIGNNRMKAVVYPISQAAHERGRSLINLIAELPVPMELPPKKEDWNRAGRLEDFIAPFDAWRFPWLDLPALFRQTEIIYEFPMIDRTPVNQWSFGRVTLVGDAAHAMRPNGSNGASQGIWDAEAVTQALLTHGDPVQALQAYEAERLVPVNQLVLSNRQTGPERVMQMAEDNCPGACTTHCTCVSRTVLEEVAANYKKLAGFDVDRVRQILA